MELLLFAVDDEVTEAAAGGGIDGVVVDLESRGKDARQSGYDTSVSHHTLDDVRRVRALTPLPLVVRVDGPGPGLRRRIAEAVDAGADEVLVPMVADAAEVDRCLRSAAPGIPVGVLVERDSAVADVLAIEQLAPARVYVGLTDLMIERGAPSPFCALTDGTVDLVRAALSGPLGVGGLTLPGNGVPVPVELLAGELVRVGADFTFLRRSFLRDLGGPQALPDAVAAIHAMVQAAQARDAEQVAADQAALAARLRPGVTA